MTDKVKRALEITSATDWSGDWRVNMTTIMGAGRTLGDEVERLQDEVLELEEKVSQVEHERNERGAEIHCMRERIAAVRLLADAADGITTDAEFTGMHRACDMIDGENAKEKEL